MNDSLHFDETVLFGLNKGIISCTYVVTFT